jgi:glyoxylase-like metal-dependent hydrolase (beta-lactamase superfamily II)
MPPEATDFTHSQTDLLTWQVFSPEHRCELTANAVLADGRWFLFDPLPLAAPACETLLQRGPVAAVVLTNANHERAAARWRELTGAPVWTDAGATLKLPGVQRFDPAAGIWEGWEIHRLTGGAPGEIALRREEASLVVLGDAVFDLPRHGLGVLPEKYCTDRPRLLTALRELVRRPFERAALAHGGPLHPEAARRLASLLSL